MHVITGRFAHLFLVIQHKSRSGNREGSLLAVAAAQIAHSEIRLDGILWLNDTHFQAKCDCKVEAGSKISAQAMKKVNVLQGVFSPPSVFCCLDFRIQLL